MGKSFNTRQALKWGSLPGLFNTEDPESFLNAYLQTYLKEEIMTEQIIRRLDPFRCFLETASQGNGEIINYSNIAKDVGADTKTVQSYYQILEDTLIGFHLPAYHKSIRKQQRHNPKFYFFDTGVKRALDNTLTMELLPNTYAFGKAFEHFLIIELIRLNDYYHKDFRFFYLRTQNQLEIDLIVERPGLPTALIEIKSASQVDERDTKTVQLFLNDFKTGTYQIF